MWFLLLAIIIGILGVTIVTFLNRKFFKNIKEIEKRVRARLSERPDLSIERQLDSDELSCLSMKGCLFLIRKIARILGVSADKLRLDDRMGDYFFGTTKDTEEVKAIPAQVAFYDDIWWMLQRNSSFKNWNNYCKENPTFCDEDDALLIIHKMSLFEFVKTAVPILKDKLL